MNEEKHTPFRNVVTLCDIKDSTITCLTACELVNSLTNELAAPKIQLQLWESGCFTDTLTRIPTGEIVPTEVLYKLVAIDKFDTFGYIVQEQSPVNDAVTGVKMENICYIFPIPRSVALNDGLTLAKSGTPSKFYINRQVIEPQGRETTPMWKKCSNGLVTVGNLTRLANDVCVQTKILKLFEEVYNFNLFNLVPHKRVLIGESQEKRENVMLYLVCPTNSDLHELEHTPEGEFKECEVLTLEQIHEKRRDALSLIMFGPPKEERPPILQSSRLFNKIDETRSLPPPRNEREASALASRVNDLFYQKIEEYNATKWLNKISQVRIQDMRPSNQEIISTNVEYGRNNTTKRTAKAVISLLTSKILCMYIRGYTKNDREVQKLYHEIGKNILLAVDLNIAPLAYLNQMDVTLQTILDQPIPNFINGIAEDTAFDDLTLKILEDVSSNAQFYVKKFAVNDVELQPPLIKLIKNDVLFYHLHEFLLHSEDMEIYAMDRELEELEWEHDIQSRLRELDVLERLHPVTLKEALTKADRVVAFASGKVRDYNKVKLKDIRTHLGYPGHELTIRDARVGHEVVTKDIALLNINRLKGDILCHYMLGFAQGSYEVTELYTNIVKQIMMCRDITMTPLEYLNDIDEDLSGLLAKDDLPDFVGGLSIDIVLNKEYSAQVSRLQNILSSTLAELEKKLPLRNKWSVDMEELLVELIRYNKLFNSLTSYIYADDVTSDVIRKYA